MQLSSGIGQSTWMCSKELSTKELVTCSVLASIFRLCFRGQRARVIKRICHLLFELRCWLQFSVCRFLKAVHNWGCPHLDSLLKKFRVIDLRSLWLIRVIFHKVAAFYFLRDKDWESFMEIILNTIMHH